MKGEKKEKYKGYNDVIYGHLLIVYNYRQIWAQV